MGPLLCAKFHPHRCNGKGIRRPKVKFLPRFDKKVEYKCPTGVYPLRDFHKICRVCTPFQAALGVEILLDLLEGLWSLGVLNWRVWLPPNFQRPHSGEIMHQTPKSFRGARTWNWNLSCKCRPWVCSSTPNLTLIGSSGSVQEPPKSKFAQNCVFWPP